MSDIAVLALALVYVSVILSVTEGLRRVLPLSVDFTRKFVHIGVGMIAFPLVVIFTHWYYAIIPPALFVVINYVSYRYGLLKVIEIGKKHQLGTVYFPISFVLLIPILWGRPALLVASLMPLTWGDAFAAIIGRRFGRHCFSISGQTRSLEGSGAMLVFSFLPVFATLVIFGIQIDTSLLLASLVACVATPVEAISPWGIDNLTIPLVSAIVLIAGAWVTGI